MCISCAGALSMNSIYDLVDKNGNSLGQALKVCKQSLSARRSLAHEWKMFKNLRVLGEEHASARSHFLQAYRVMKLSNNQIVGIIMEKANGSNVSKTLADPNFCNVRYVISLLRDLLVALDVAQRVLGFVHYDLKLDNVMEHWSCNADVDDSKKRVLIDGVPQFKLFDFGTAVVYGDPFAVKKVPNKRLTGERKPEAAEELKHEKKHGDSDKPGIITHSAATDEYEYSEPYVCVRVYHMWWKARGDVFRVLLALCKKLDDRVWPIEDLELVSLLFTVLEHTTNSKRIRAKFTPRAALLRKLGLSEIPQKQQNQLQPQHGVKACQLQQQKQQQKQTGLGSKPTNAAADMPHAIAPAADGGRTSPVPRRAADAPRSPRVSMDTFSNNNRPFGSATGTTTSSNGGVVNMISSMVNSSAAAGDSGMFGNAAVGANAAGAGAYGNGPSADSVEAMPGVAYTRLAPVSSSTAAAAPDSTSMQLPVSTGLGSQQQQAPGSIRIGAPAAGGEVGIQKRTASAGVPPEANYDVNAPDEGCVIDPAARIIEQMPVVPADHQSVLGSRKALKGVTAQQLLVEPIVQSLLSKV
eukprot:GHUV01007369.1.p1 GENE.GHUV01007369.1~~GHUV01007369.1.p1  ORF type:complete len:581 (+),score=255.61 GHUV01007369.1:365-2107(+)